ncbi:UDP-2,4-diacetamido-2,4,6-trideoxy-beta-L-altropyranose hydrolase [Roseibium sp.]|uniref:UDP-2,4-diacetamido-2,4, 6-trideoxy-beta-L-altropyranose hydrolase n=1 Tax=Roseibium sp. TaxID=1936156 RepID=UPI003B514DB3
MKIAFRVDASSMIGTGHVVRCLTLADRLSDLGAECSFITRQHVGHMGNNIRARGFQVKVLELSAPETETGTAGPHAHSHWLGVTIERDAEQTLQAIDKQVDWLIVDHYALDRDWERALRVVTGKIAVIDDLADRPHDCDLLLDQTFFASGKDRYAELVPEDCLKLFGPRYALLQKDYRQLRPERPDATPVKSIVVFYGGSDQSNETARAVRVLSQTPFADLEVNVVLGATNRHSASVEELCAKRPGTTIHKELKSLAPLLAEADLALGAGGTSSWERCALGLPAVVTSIAENQLPLADELNKAGLIYYAGDWRTITDEGLRQVLLQAVSDQDKNADMSLRSRELTDAFGADRVAEYLVPPSRDHLHLSPARQDHKKLFFLWANDPSVRQNAFSSDPIEWETHSAWYDRKLADPACHVWVLLSRSGLPVGQLRLEPRACEYLVDFSIDSLFRGRGYGKLLLEKMLEEKRHLPQVKRITGEVKAGNTASLGAFRKTAAFSETFDEAREVHRFTVPNHKTAV